ncbi:MAG: serine/threonine-protein kinase [Nannocystaceae bacterium]|nr:serine/threonine-protein kinase [Nannocystaceae bacterium]
MTVRELGLVEAVRDAEDWDRVDAENALAAVSKALFDRPPAPLQLSRYIVLERIGAGAVGSVHAGFDPELRRSVAIKVIAAPRGEGDAAAATRELLREAHAIASLRHPNVVTVHDVGLIGEGHRAFAPGVFIVMERVEGEPLSRWAHGRSWRAIAAVMLQVGRGLRAAHEAGLIHRDVKPANVMVGRDGRAMLVDFGLACAATPGPLETLDGVPLVVGTPATMSPEQHAGGPLDARSDQYGYCAAFYLALTGRPPCLADDLPTLVRLKRGGQIAPVVGLPRWLDAMLRRGLAGEPEARFPDMGALLDRLERGLGRRRRWWTAAALAASLGATAAIAWAAAGPSAIDRCTHALHDDLARVWNPASRDEVRAGLLATAVPGADAVAGRVDALLDDVAVRWIAEVDGACAAADRTGDAGARAAQLGCLDDVRAEVGVLTEILAQAEPELVEVAVDAVRRVSPPESCRDATAGPPRSASFEAALRRAHVFDVAGRLRQAETLARSTRDEARAAGDVDAEARAAAILCRVALDRAVDAEAVCADAQLAAERAGNEVLAIMGSIYAVRRAPDAPEAARTLALTEARAQRHLARVPHLALELAETRVSVAEAQRRFDEALDRALDALALAEQTHGPDDDALVPMLNVLGGLQLRLGRFDDAADSYQRAIAILEHLRGADHPTVGALLTNLAGVELARERFAVADALLQRALRIKMAGVGADSPRLVTTLHRIARLELRRGNLEEARRVSAHAAALAAGSNDALLVARGDVLASAIAEAAGACDEAESHAGAAAEVFAARAPEHELFAELERVRGRCALRRGQLDEARGAFATALDHVQWWYGPDATDLVAPLLDVAQVALRMADDAAAESALEEAVRLAQQGELPPGVAARLAAAVADPAAWARQPIEPLAELRVE